MTFKQAGNDKINGTSLIDCIDIKYSELVRIFGEPHRNEPEPGNKTDAEWLLEFEDGTIATIYNYKDGKNYNGRSGATTSMITDWHVGGHNRTALDKVLKTIKDNN